MFCSHIMQRISQQIPIRRKAVVVVVVVKQRFLLITEAASSLDLIQTMFYRNCNQLFTKTGPTHNFLLIYFFTWQREYTPSELYHN